jgi:glycosyltransferase involved in cell wall biosynthesis
VTTDPECRSTTVDDWEGVRLHRLPRPGRKILSDATGPGRRLVSDYVTRLQPDVIHAHDVFGLMVKGLPIPRVFTIHGFIYGDTLVSGERFAWLRSKLWERVEKAGWADQPHIISISPYVRERLAGIATGVIHDIDNPIDSSFFDLPRREKKGTIFSAALICPRKNPIALVEAVAKLRDRGVDCELRLAGPAEDEYGRRLKECIDRRNIGDRVHLLGRIGMDQVRQELTAASIFALVSLEENSPMGIEEAMAVGVPVVTSNRCGMPYMVRDGESGFLVDPHNADDIAWRLEQVLTDDDLRTSMGEVSKRIALDRFHPVPVARRTREVYLRAVRAGTRGK